MKAKDLGIELWERGHQQREVVILPLDAPIHAANYRRFSEVTCFWNGEMERFCVTLRSKRRAGDAIACAAHLRAFRGRIGPLERGHSGEEYRVIVGDFIAFTSPQPDQENVDG